MCSNCSEASSISGGPLAPALKLLAPQAVQCPVHGLAGGSAAEPKGLPPPSQHGSIPGPTLPTQPLPAQKAEQLQVGIRVARPIQSPANDCCCWSWHQLVPADRAAEVNHPVLEASRLWWGTGAGSGSGTAGTALV
jgi:hypothetical protein